MISFSRDDRTSDICRPLHGLAYRYDNPIWNTLYPPNHYSCRTTVVAMTAEDALDQGYRIVDGWPKDPDTGAGFMPQRGFEGNIGKVGLGDLVPSAAELGNYDAAQPRDDHGRWGEGSYSGVETMSDLSKATAYKRFQTGTKTVESQDRKTGLTVQREVPVYEYRRPDGTTPTEAEMERVGKLARIRDPNHAARTNAS